MPKPISSFMEENFKHFNAFTTLRAARAWVDHEKKGGKMFLAMAGAMSTAEIGISLAEMIREDKIHAISCSAANLEEDIFNLIAHNEYEMVPDYDNLTPDDEEALRDRGMNRVTDVCIPENVMRKVENKLIEYWAEAAKKEEHHFPYEYLFRLFDEGFLNNINQVPFAHSWMAAAWEKKIPIYSPGWEDSTLGNIFAARVMDGTIRSHAAIRHGTEQFAHLMQWYQEISKKSSVGFFQIGGGTAGDFALCCVPCILLDLGKECPHWAYYAQITDSTTSYGSYSGCTPKEKITWHKVTKNTPSFVINSDATIVAPLIFSYVLGK
ncbi:MAG TPA: deoxyhypusine synthase [Candidatus Peribacter riflensis]|uniref:Deoxyhypusine synthase n=1 Tax=Candidatus Peribacter riflensis TaxID=1735162 RepID=A0A0S1SW09_9BACT|nr:MAG: deoxyhypusine synthase [Candidatus Peribacter riflensis]OGJ77539.1 MAG: deoxyhypusine synthase [Candidatus Peribacteria bacterium RIFOXYB1_FULL_57_12]OGJ78747.1 MAG: deoxyhypusine synthase [Candidatus Peribacteria bacterium RIFOXYC1_FULL_58_8]ALM10582.1 MAG: deoxyhypusine synthase [Candidatus Peribacter riflensis]ALM11684.1 MAG: deoxyhypusine synthase [Candidatus Peribacter riflensis]